MSTTTNISCLLGDLHNVKTLLEAERQRREKAEAEVKRLRFDNKRLLKTLAALTAEADRLYGELEGEDT